MELVGLGSRYVWFRERTLLHDTYSAQRTIDSMQAALEQIMGINMATHELGILDGQLDLYYILRYLNQGLGGRIDLDRARQNILGTTIPYRKFKSLAAADSEEIERLAVFLRQELPDSYRPPFSFDLRERIEHHFDTDDLRLLFCGNALPGYTMLRWEQPVELGPHRPMIAYNAAKNLLMEWQTVREELASAFISIGTYGFMPLMQFGGEKFYGPLSMRDVMGDENEVNELDLLLLQGRYTNNELVRHLFLSYAEVFDRVEEDKELPGRYSPSWPLKRNPLVSTMLQKYRMTIDDLTIGEAADFFQKVDVYRSQNRLSSTKLYENIIGLNKGVLQLTEHILFNPELCYWT